MKRDMDVLRRILLALEDAPAGRGKMFVYDTRLADVDNAVLKEHVHLANDERLAEFDLLDLLDEWVVNRARLTSRGHDFLDAVRTTTRLRKAIAWITATGRDVTVQLIIEWAQRVASSE